MTEHDDLEDVTLPAGDDVVSQIRAHAARLRQSGPPGASPDVNDGLQVWTPGAGVDVDEADDADEVTGDGDLFEVTVPMQRRPAVSSTSEATAPAQEVLEDDPTDPSAREVAATVAAEAEVIDPEDTESLTAGKAPPAASVSFWDGGRMSEPEVVEPTSHTKRSMRMPLWVLIALAAIVIVAASVAIALAITGTEPVPVPA